MPRYILSMFGPDCVAAMNSRAECVSGSIELTGKNVFAATPPQPVSAAQAPGGRLAVPSCLPTMIPLTGIAVLITGRHSAKRTVLIAAATTSAFTNGAVRCMVRFLLPLTRWLRSNTDGNHERGGDRGPGDVRRNVVARLCRDGIRTRGDAHAADAHACAVRERRRRGVALTRDRPGADSRVRHFVDGDVERRRLSRVIEDADPDRRGLQRLRQRDDAAGDRRVERDLELELDAVLSRRSRLAGRQREQSRHLI